MAKKLDMVVQFSLKNYVLELNVPINYIKESARETRGPFVFSYQLERYICTYNLDHFRYAKGVLLL